MSQSNNPVARLYRILEAARSQPEISTFQDVFAKILNIDPKDTKTLICALADLVTLVEAAKTRLSKLDVDRELYLKPFGNIEQVFANLNMGMKWTRYKSYLDDITMQALRFGVDTVNRQVSEADISDETLTKLLTEVEGLLKQVLDSTLTDELKTAIIQKLEEIRLAIITYQINGIEGLQRALESSLGAVFLNREEVAKVQDDKDKGIIRGVIQVVANLAQILGFALQVAQLPSIAPYLLGPGGNP